jgi:hypothetical protein
MRIPLRQFGGTSPVSMAAEVNHLRAELADSGERARQLETERAKVEAEITALHATKHFRAAAKPRALYRKMRQA